MKTKIFSLLALGFMSLGFAACSDDPNYPGGSDANGRLSLDDLGVSVSTDEVEISRADETIDTSSFLVNIKDSQGQTVYSSTMADRQEVLVLPVGEKYSISIESHEVANAAWSAPYYAGSKEFDIKENEITSIGTVTCRFSNIRVSVRYSDKLTRMMREGCQVAVNCSENGSSLVFGKNETRSGYFKALEGSTTLAAVFTGNVNGTDVNLTRALTDVAAGQHRVITFDVKDINNEVPDEMGYIDLGGEGQGQKIGDGLYIVSSVTDENISGNVDPDETAGDDKRPGSDENLGGGEDPNPPTTSTEYIKFETTMSFDTPQPTAGASGLITISTVSDADCPDNTIQMLKVEIIPGNKDFDDALTEVQMPKVFDLADVPDDRIEIMEGFGFPYNDGVKGQPSVLFDIQQFVPLLDAFPGTHSFRITVSDSHGHTEVRTLSFIAQ